MLLVRIQYESIEIWYSSKSLWLFSHFDAENYARRYDMVRKFLCLSDFFGTNVPKYIPENILKSLPQKLYIKT